MSTSEKINTEIKSPSKDNNLSKERSQLQPKTQENKFQSASEKKENIFATKTPMVNIFSIPIVSQQQKPSENIFTKNLGTVNLFQVTANNLPQNIFSKATDEKPLISRSGKKVSEQNNDSDKEQLQNQQQPLSEQNTFHTQPKDKKMHYEYKSDLTLIDSFKVLKFRNGMNHTKQLVTVCLSKKADESKISGLQFHVENSTTHIVLFQGVIIKNISKIQPFMGKQENLKVLILVMNKNEGNQQKPKFIRQTAKLQFSSKQEANKFKQIVQQFLGIKKND